MPGRGWRDELVVAYLEARDHLRLMVFSHPHGKPSRIATELLPHFSPIEALYFDKPGHAALVRDAVMDRFHRDGRVCDSWIDQPGWRVREAVHAAAVSLGARYLVRQQAINAARQAVSHIVETVERARAKGELRLINARYKDYRANALARGEKPLCYNEFLLGIVRHLVVLAARDGSRTS